MKHKKLLLAPIVFAFAWHERPVRGEPNRNGMESDTIVRRTVDTTPRAKRKAHPAGGQRHSRRARRSTQRVYEPARTRYRAGANEYVEHGFGSRLWWAAHRSLDFPIYADIRHSSDASVSLFYGSPAWHPRF
jgi:hypothetical protein